MQAGDNAGRWMDVDARVVDGYGCKNGGRDAGLEDGGH